MNNILKEILKTFQFIWMIIQTLFMYNESHILLEKEEINYKINNENKSAILYKRIFINNNKNIYFFSGGFILSYTIYIKKAVTDLIKYFPFSINDYNLIVIEKEDQCNISLYDDIPYIIENTISKNIEEIIFIGFSGGGVISSHVLNRLKNKKVKKKLILYDSTFSVIDSIKEFNKFYFYRIDYLMYILVRNSYLNHYNYNKIKNIINNYPYIHSVDKFIEMVKSVHNFDDETLYKEASFNCDQEKSTKIIYLYSKFDHLITQDLNITHNEKYNINNLNINNLNKNTLGHCSDMAFSRKYLNYLIYAILY